MYTSAVYFRLGRPGAEAASRPLLLASRSREQVACATWMRELLFLFNNFRFSLFRALRVADNWIEPGHHRAQFLADLLNLMLGVGAAHGLEAGLAGLVLQNPGSSEGAILDLAQDLAHLVAHALINQARPGDIIAEFGS